MGKETRLFKSEERKTRADVSTFLHQLAGKISDGNVVLSQGAKEIVLQIPQNVVLEVQVEDEEKKLEESSTAWRSNSNGLITTNRQEQLN